MDRSMLYEFAALIVLVVVLWTMILLRMADGRPRLRRVWRRDRRWTPWLGVLLLVIVVMSVASCSALTKQETTASNIPSAATLTAQCIAGAAQTPPIRAGACDDFNAVQTGCITLAAQPLVPAAALAPCAAGGYVTSGPWTKL